MFTFYTRNSDLLKPRDCKHGRPQGRVGKSRPSPPPPLKKVFWLYWGPFCYFFFIYRGLFDTFLSFFGGPFHHVGPFYFMVEAFFWACPLRKFLRAPMIARRVREHAPRKFLCDSNLVSSGHVL